MSHPEFDPHGILDVLPTPILVVTPRGLVRYANRAVQTLVKHPLVGLNLSEFHPPDSLHPFLSRCSGSTGELVGRVTLPQADGKAIASRCHGSRLRSHNEALVLLRCNPATDERFVLLTDRVNALGAEVRRHQRTQAVLEEALHERELLVREVHHRVKNNIQILLGMLQSAIRESKHVEVRQQLGEAASRLNAMATVQHALYDSERLTVVRMDASLRELISELRKMWGEPVHIEAVTEPVELPVEAASALALIVNELLTNAIKYATPSDASTRIRVQLTRSKEMIEVRVEDNGPGFAPQEAGRRSSGLGLVRGLTRQLSGRFQVEPGPGARCLVQFPYRDPQSEPRQEGENAASRFPKPTKH